MPDSLSLIADVREISFAQRVAILRRPLPSHAIEGGNFRRWAVAVCRAEVKHRDRDYERVERELGLAGDRWLNPRDVERGQYPHEAHAAAALHWLLHLQAHESEKRTPWSFIPWCDWKRESRAAWLAQRRYLWSGFLRCVRAYQSSKGEG